MAVPAGALDPKFDGYAFSTVGFVAGSSQLDLGHAGRVQSAALWDGSVSPRAKRDGRTIRITGTLIGTSPQDAEENLGTLLKNLRGTDRIKYGRLDLYGNGHWWAQLLNTVRGSHLRGAVGPISITLDFFAPDPYRRADTLISISESPSLTNPTVTITFASEFNGDAPRIPYTLNCGGGWQKNEKLRLYNSTTGVWFQHVVTQNLTATQDLIIDGEGGYVMEGTEIVGEGVSGSLPFIRGGVTNTLDFTGTDRFGTYTVEFFDRFM